MQKPDTCNLVNACIALRAMLCCFFFLSALGYPSNAQNCPPNLDFERGDFSGWTCYAGMVAAVGGQNVITINPTTPVNGQHTIMTRGSGFDPYGSFPVTSPNGSGYSVKLGNDFGGGQAEGLSYEFNIPANRNTYTLIYNYAVVFQDPNHQQYQQPRMEIEITNVTDNILIDCSSFTFIPYGSGLPGFFMSPNTNNNAPVWCKDWSSVSINLDGNAGKRIRLMFKTADCTFTRHFGYAYIDVNTECTGEFVGATFCKADSAVTVVAPPGYDKYTWFDSSLTQVIGNNPSLTLSPVPRSGSTVAV
ncbi:MAG TPA: hypothetical protein VM368_00040, partial [Flavisolibacter sp.]|nr:hypothetical protein [Flavisolibacter sp.]